MKYAYDFHIHSCLSPCGDADMTPYNLVNMAKILGLDIIALTDHNTAGNCRAAVQAGKEAGIEVIAGMELCTAEEIHVVCLFPDVGAAESFWAEVKKQIPPVKNKPGIFGEQLYMDSLDNVLGNEEILLVTASGITIDETPGFVEKFGGFCYPAHIDRSSFSILSSLGVFPPELGFTCAEITSEGDVAALKEKNPALENVRVMRSSDAHYLESMHEASDTIELADCTSGTVISYLRSLD